MDEAWFQAAEQGNARGIEKMLRDGAPINALDPWERTALMLAVKGGNVEAVELLLGHGADVSSRDGTTWTVLTYAVDRRSTRNRPPRCGWCATGPHLGLVGRLVEAGAQMSLREAVILGDVELVRAFCDAGAEPSDRARWYWDDTYLMVASDLGHVDVVRLLLDRGADIARTDDLGHQALMRAALSGHADVVTLLLDRGADINACWPFESALSEAATEGHQHVVNVLLSRGARRCLIDAVALGEEILVEEMLQDPEHRYCLPYPYRGSVVLDAVIRGHTSIVRRILEHDDKHTSDLSLGPLGDQPFLAEAARQGHLEVAKLLLERGADPHAIGEDGLSPLDWAVRQGHEHFVTVLKQASDR